MPPHLGPFLEIQRALDTRETATISSAVRAILCDESALKAYVARNRGVPSEVWELITKCRQHAEASIRRHAELKDFLHLVFGAMLFGGACAALGAFASQTEAHKLPVWLPIAAGMIGTVSIVVVVVRFLLRKQNRAHELVDALELLKDRLETLEKGLPRDPDDVPPPRRRFLRDIYEIAAATLAGWISGGPPKNGKKT